MNRTYQKDWKRTQVRIPQDLYNKVVKHAERENTSLNTAMLQLIKKGLK